MPAPKTLLDKAQVIVLFGFCLLNPFAGWAYLAQARQARSLRPPSIADTLKPARLAVLPLIPLIPSIPSIPSILVSCEDEVEIGDDWAEAFEVDFVAHDDVDVVPLARTSRALDPDRDVLTLGKSVHADLVLDARALVADDELRVYGRLVRLADASVRWSELFVGRPDDLAGIRERIQLAILTRM